MTSGRPAMGMADFHTHIIPGIDDGSRSAEMSIEMIKTSVEYGAGAIVLTPHFYATQDNPKHFFEKREKCMRTLASAGAGKLIPIRYGAEVAFFDGIAETDELKKLRISGTKNILIEMPFHPWPQRVADEIMALNRNRDYQIILAHIERFFDYFKPETFDMFLSQGILMQSNAEFFIDQRTRKKALKLLEEGKIHILGSDCHNMTTRKPNLGEACEIISGRLGDGVIEEMVKRSHLLLKKVI